MYVFAGVVLFLACTLFRPITVGLFRAAVLVVRPRKPRASVMSRVNAAVAQSTPLESATAIGSQATSPQK